MARMRMTGLAAAYRVQQSTGLETVLHFPVRGRNLLRVQGDLLAAHALGVRNLFVTMGDPASIGDYPQAFDNHDIVPTGLVQLIKEQFNCGRDSAGASIGSACTFTVGVAANLPPGDPEKEAKLLKKKIDCGADFALTQPVFDAEAALAFLAYYERMFGRLTLPILAGILPLASARQAVFLKNEVPGMMLPDALVARMDAAGEDAREEGVRAAAETLHAIRPAVQGVYFIPAFRRYDILARLIKDA
jgi:homocysteine S-methyltransferase